MLALTITSVSSAQSPEPTEVPAYLFKGAVPIERAPPDYPMNALFHEKEGWVNVNFIIDKTGKPTDIVITDSAGAKSFRRAAISAVEGWRFEPATLNGEPVLQCRNDHRVSFRLNPPSTAASPNFVARYRRASRVLEKGDIERARKFVRELREYGTNNFYETGAYWNLRLRLAAKEQDFSMMRHAAGRVVAHDQGQVPADSTRQAAIIRYKLLVQDNFFGEAKNLRARFADLGVDDDDPSLAPYHARLAAAEEEIPAYGTKGRINHEVWSIVLVKPSFYLEDVSGDIRDIEIRCAHHRESAAQGQASDESVARRLLFEDKAWLVPERWGGECHVMVYGDPGTEFTMVQQSVANTR
ncbi:MAG: energy transducer TonB [Pseudomonadota bacterium]